MDPRAHARPRFSAHSSVSLSVRSNSIGKEGLLSLARAVKVTSTLTDINIWGNYLGEPVSQVTRGFSTSCLLMSARLRLYWLVFRLSNS